MGLAAALGARERGFDVTVLEAADVGHALRRWGPTRFFSPLAMNVTDAMRRCLRDSLPPADALLTGPEFAQHVLVPLAESSELRGSIRTGHRVAAVGRAGMTRMEMAGHPLRAAKPFRVLVETAAGDRTFEADVVLDASGVTGLPCLLGAGGLPARGERRFHERIIRDLGTLHEWLFTLAGKVVLLVGHGHSAAGALLALADLAARDSATRVIWAVRSGNRRPCVEIADDPLPERQRVAAGANDLAAAPPPFLDLQRWTSVEWLEDRGGRITVAFGKNREAQVDAVVSLTGYRPDLRFLTELPLEISPATEGAARLSRALGDPADGLTVPRLEARDLESGEPGFFLVGAKSYGRSRNFLLQAGFAQLETILGLASG